jgi:hypothetical protein
MSRQLSDSARRQRANKVSRRAFGQLLVGATAAVTVPLFVPARLLGAAAPSNRLRVGQIGCGRIAQVHDVPSVLKSGLADSACRSIPRSPMTPGSRFRSTCNITSGSAARRRSITPSSGSIPKRATAGLAGCATSPIASA